MVGERKVTLPISVFMVVKNEEQHIAKALASVSDMAEVIVVDSGSTDNTVAIAQSMGAKVFFHEWQGYAKQKQYAMSLCSQEWVLNLDGDEEITLAVKKRFAKIIAEDSADCVRMQRDDVFIGKILPSLVKKRNNHRLYKRSKSYFDDGRLAHESAHVDGKEVSIREAFIHYGYDSISAVTNKSNTYSALKAQEKFLKNKKDSVLKLVLIFPLIFIKEYIFQRKIFAGKRGFILSVMEAYYAFLKEAKLYEFHERNKS